MKNFLSQTWVVAIIALIILAIVATTSYKLSHKEETEDYSHNK